MYITCGPMCNIFLCEHNVYISVHMKVMCACTSYACLCLHMPHVCLVWMCLHVCPLLSGCVPCTSVCHLYVLCNPCIYTICVACMSASCESVSHVCPVWCVYLMLSYWQCPAVSPTLAVGQLPLLVGNNVAGRRSLQTRVFGQQTQRLQGVCSANYFQIGFRN